jgi:hypothetical protein
MKEEGNRGGHEAADYAARRLVEAANNITENALK